MTSYAKALSLLTSSERRRGALVLLMVVVMAVLETAGVASVLPFLAVLGNPEIVEDNPIFTALYAKFGSGSVDDFLFMLGATSFAIIIFAAGFRIVTVFAMNQYTQLRRHSIGERLLETYLRQPYSFYLNRHSSDLAKNILSEVDQLVAHVFKPAFEVLAYSFVVAMLVTLLLIVDPKLALTIGLVIGGVYLLVFLTVKGVLGRIGRERVHANRLRFGTAGEALAGIKDIKLFGREHAYLARFRTPSRLFAEYQATNLTLSAVPKYVIEAVAFGGLLLLSLFLMSTTDGVGDVLPVLGLYAFAGYRLLPAAQYIYAGCANLRFGVAAIDAVFDDLELRASMAEISSDVTERLIPTNAIEMIDVTFTYPNASEAAVTNMNLTIPVGTSVGLVGTTGAGKTTMVDLILGLLHPTSGRIAVDGFEIDEFRRRSWQKSLGYVPQNIFMIDASVSENIAFGVPQQHVDTMAVEQCARLAQVHDFVVTALPLGYETKIGERGVRLSGGQRQRIGIARALYHDPAVLVFDEATSALDIATEKSVMSAIHAIKGSKTVILIAHRITTVRECDMIVLLDHGTTRAAGTYDELMAGSPDFRAIAGVAVET